MKSHLLLALTLLLPLLSHAQTPAPGGLLASIALLPQEYRQGIIKVSADDADPNPDTWYFLARNSNKANDIYSIEMTRGTITEEKPSMNFGALLGKPTSINLQSLKLDSLGVWEVALAFCRSHGRQLSSASYVLKQEGASAAPIWSIWCYDPKGDKIGEIQVLATNGSIISSKM